MTWPLALLLVDLCQCKLGRLAYRKIFVTLASNATSSNLCRRWCSEPLVACRVSD